MEVIKTASCPNSIFRSLLLIPENSEEWNIMWGKLATHKLNKGLANPTIADNYGEVWQYMESHKRLFGYVHLFRHRLHPKTDRKACIKIRSSLKLKIMENP